MSTQNTISKKSVYNKQLKIPSSIFYKNEFETIRSILGNDVEIIKYDIQDVITRNDEVVVNVEYSMIDFSLFDVYFVEKIKKLNLASNVYVAEEIKRISSDEVENDSIKSIVLIQMTVPHENFYVMLKNYCQSMENENIVIKYFAIEIKNPSDLLHSFCNMFSVKLLSYHGTMLKCPTVSFKTNLTVDAQKETDVFNKMSVVSSGYNCSCYDITCFKNFDTSNVLPIVKLKDITTVAEKTCVIIDYTNVDSLDEFKKIKHGLFWYSNERNNPYTCIYYNDPLIQVTPEMINNMIIAMSYDIINYIKVFGPESKMNSK